ncbi:MAG TPA: multidrug ABC transporter ATP-binding protein [Rhodospirillaceae bacterium]|nr:multidrug ABC transporter ATP-binding protein [Rhodospirillaceae bacterium]
MTKPTVPPESVPQNALEIKGLVKMYHGRRAMDEKLALAGVDLVVPRGCLFGLLGTNGAGKSTLINILAGLVVKTEGTVKVWGVDKDQNPRFVQSAIGVVPQEINIDTFFTPRELLEFQAGLYGVPPKERITNYLLEMLSLMDVADASMRSLSGGMRRRLMVAKAMVHRPPVLVLDEPTAGVDVELRRALWDHIRDLQKAGTTILLTTHYLEEAQELCDNIAILREGKLVANDTKYNLLAQMDNKSLTITVDRDLHDVPPNLRPHGWTLEGKRRLKLPAHGHTLSLGQMLLSVQVNGLNIVDIVTYETNLEDVFLNKTQGTKDDAPSDKPVYPSLF